MKLLLILFVALTVVATICTGRTISRTLCEKIVSCKNSFLSTPVPTQKRDWHPQNNDNTNSMANYETAKNEFPYHEGSIMVDMFACPGGVPQFRSGGCSAPLTSDLIDYNDFIDAK